MFVTSGGECYRNIIWRETFQFQKRYKISVVCVTVKVNITNKMDTRSEMRHSKFKRICGFYGSSPDKKSTYQDAAIELGNELVSYIFMPSFSNRIMFFFCFPQNLHHKKINIFSYGVLNTLLPLSTSLIFV